MKGMIGVIAKAGLLTVLTGCQYFSYYKTNTTSYPANFQNSAMVSCEAMGAEPGTATLDWCIAQEEHDRQNRY